MDRNKLYYEYTASLNPYDVDKHSKATLTGINQLIDKAAFNHIYQLGYSTQSMLKKKKAWVLFQKEFKIIDRLVLNKEYLVKTRITGKDKLFTYRDFIITDEAGQVQLQVVSSWIFFDLDKRVMLRSYPEELDKLIEAGNEIKAFPRPERMKSQDIVGAENMVRHRIGFMDIDASGHASNQSLLRKMLENIPYRSMNDMEIEDFRIQFKSECFLDDTVEITSVESSPRHYLINCTIDDKLIAFAEAKFTERKW